MTKNVLVPVLAVLNFGFIELPVRPTPIVGDDIRCETASGGGAVAIDIDGRKVWQTDPGEATGLEVTVDEAAQTAPLVEAAGMGHDALYSRLFQS